MGVFRNGGTKYFTTYYHEIEDFLIKSGYKFDSGPTGERGYVKVYPTDDNLYYIWITFDLKEKRMYIFKEYDCGGCVDATSVNIEYWMGDLETFINEVDEEFEYWFGE